MSFYDFCFLFYFKFLTEGFMCKRQKKGFNKKKMNWFVTKEKKKSLILQKDRNVLGNFGVDMWVHKLTLQQI